MMTDVQHSQRHETATEDTVAAFDQPLVLDSGTVLPRLDIAYETYGSLNDEGTNALLVCHALTGNAQAGDPIPGNGAGQNGWWSGVVGAGKGLDTDRYFVICSNILGSCYGTTGPTSLDPSTGHPYRTSFPQVTVRDMVRAQHLLLQALGVRQLASVIGGSLGGMQALEWGIMYPDFVRSIIPVATAAKHSAWCIGFSEAQRLAIMSDPEWDNGNYQHQPSRGLAIARMIAMISYRSRPSFEARFGRDKQVEGGAKGTARTFPQPPPTFGIESYLRYQGQKLVDRFDANSYLSLTRTMDLHDVGAGRGSVSQALSGIKARALCIGISSDILYPVDEQKAIASSIPGAVYAEIDSIHGHDAFLIETEQVNTIVRSFLGRL